MGLPKFCASLSFSVSLFCNILQASLELINHSLDRETSNSRDTVDNYEIHRPRSVAVVNSSQDNFEANSDVVIVPKRGPRPPARRRPKSTPIRYENEEKVFKS